jgi:glucose 1-dehydrogenase
MGTSLAGRAAIVTGASRGIGRACAKALAAAGATVIVNHLPRGRSTEAAEAVVREIEADGGKALALPADVSDETQVEQMFAAALERVGGVDIAVANAGIEAPAPAAGMTLADWRRVIDVNLTGAFLTARAALRGFTAPGRKPKGSALGNIVFISSVHQLIPWAGEANYAASKGGVMQLMRSLAQELAPQRIRVNAVAPGAIRTDINRDAWETPEAEKRLLTLIPYGRVGLPEDVARAVAWLACDDSDYVTGATLFVDGGMSLFPAFRDNG